MLRRSEAPFSGVQRAVFAALFAWRDAVCREEDEGVGYVLPRAALLNLAQNMPGAWRMCATWRCTAALQILCAALLTWTAVV